MTEIPHIRVTASAFIRNSEGKYFLHRSPKWKDRWVIPGGGVEYGETLTDAAIREAREETGYAVKPLHVVNIVGSINPPRYYKPAHFVHVHFLCELAGGKYQPDPKEVTEGRWVTLEEGLALTDGSVHRSLENIRDGKYLMVSDT